MRIFIINAGLQDGFTAEYIVQNMKQADILLESIEEKLKHEGYADTLFRSSGKI